MFQYSFAHLNRQSCTHVLLYDLCVVVVADVVAVAAAVDFDVAVAW